jgi:hypothetical protein
MPAALAHEHQPVVWSDDEAMGAAKPPRCVYDQGRHSSARLDATTLAKFFIGRGGGAIDVPRMRTENTHFCVPPLGSAYTAVIGSQNGFSTAQPPDVTGNRAARLAVRSDLPTI